MILEKIKRGPRTCKIGIGYKSERLTVLEVFHDGVRWMTRCSCECGNTSFVYAISLIRNATRSCGCLQREAASRVRKTHGMHKTPTCRIWYGMIARCERPYSKGFANYGGRGISICDRWRASFPAFLEDMGEKPNGMSIERKNNNGNYEPGNCIWASRRDQQNNTRMNHIVSVHGEQMTLAQLARKTGMKYELLRSRIKRGMAPEKAIVAKSA